MAKKFSSLLVRDNIVSIEKMEEALQRQVIFGGRLGTNLLEMGVITEVELGHHLAQARGVRAASAEMFTNVDPDALELLDIDTIEHLGVIPVRLHPNGACDALVLDDLTGDQIEQLRVRTGFQFIQHIAPEFRFRQALQRFFERPFSGRVARLLERFPLKIDLGLRSNVTASTIIQARPTPRRRAGGRREVTLGQGWTPEEVSQYLRDCYVRDVILAVLLGYAGSFAARRMLLVVLRHRLQGYAAAGEDVPGDELRKIRLRIRAGGAIERVCRGDTYYQGSPTDGELVALYDALHIPSPANCLLLPVPVGPRAALVLLMDHEGHTFDTHDLEPLFLIINDASESLERIIRLTKSGELPPEELRLPPLPARLQHTARQRDPDVLPAAALPPAAAAPPAAAPAALRSKPPAPSRLPQASQRRQRDADLDASKLVEAIAEAMINTGARTTEGSGPPLQDNTTQLLDRISLDRMLKGDVAPGPSPDKGALIAGKMDIPGEPLDALPPGEASMAEALLSGLTDEGPPDVAALDDDPHGSRLELDVAERPAVQDLDEIPQVGARDTSALGRHAGLDTAGLAPAREHSADGVAAEAALEDDQAYPGLAAPPVELEGMSGGAPERIGLEDRELFPDPVSEPEQAREPGVKPSLIEIPRMVGGQDPRDASLSGLSGSEDGEVSEDLIADGWELPDLFLEGLANGPDLNVLEGLPKDLDDREDLVGLKGLDDDIMFDPQGGPASYELKDGADPDSMDAESSFRTDPTRELPRFEYIPHPIVTDYSDDEDVEDLGHRDTEALDAVEGPQDLPSPTGHAATVELPQVDQARALPDERADYVKDETPSSGQASSDEEGDQDEGLSAADRRAEFSGLRRATESAMAALEADDDGAATVLMDTTTIELELIRESDPDFNTGPLFESQLAPETSHALNQWRPVVEGLWSSDPDVQDEARRALIASGGQALPALLERFPGPVLIDRYGFTAQTLPPISEHSPLLGVLVDMDDLVAPALASFMNVSSVEVRFYATFFFSRVRYEPIVGPMIQQLFDKDGQIREVARQIIRSYRNTEGFHAVQTEVRRELAYGDSFRREQAALAACAFGDTLAVPSLIELLEHENRHLTKVAHKVLCALTFEDLGNNKRKWTRWWERSASQSRSDWLIEALNHGQREIRQLAANELRQCTGLIVNYSPDSSRRDRLRAQQIVAQFFNEGSGRW